MGSAECNNSVSEQLGEGALFSYRIIELERLGNHTTAIGTDSRREEEDLASGGKEDNQFGCFSVKEGDQSKVPSHHMELNREM